MTDDTSPVSRRDVLTGMSGADGTETITDPLAASAAGERVVVGLTADASFEFARDHADSLSSEMDFEHVGKVVTGHFAPDALEAIRARDEVRYVEADSEYRVLGEAVPWGVDRVDADVAHDAGFTGGGADIAIIDTGIDDDHPDLEGNVGSGSAFGVQCGSAGDCRYGDGPNANDCNYAWSDDHDHGTHCAGIAAAVANRRDVVGVATDATLHAVKVFDACGRGKLSNLVSGIKYVADQGWDVASMSVGAPSGNQALEDACRYATDQGVLLVAAAGNAGPCTDCVTYPAVYSSVVAVSSTNPDDTLSDFSSTGPSVELAAPGGAITSTVPPESSADATATFNGTSMACPHVAGAGGLLMAAGQTAAEARATLQETAEDLGLSDSEQGHGLLDAEAAAKSAGGEAVVATGTLGVIGPSDTAECYFEWRETGAGTWNRTTAQTRSEPGRFSDTVGALAPDTAYEFRAVAEGSNGATDVGATVTVTTAA